MSEHTAPNTFGGTYHPFSAQLLFRSHRPIVHPAALAENSATPSSLALESVTAPSAAETLDVVRTSTSNPAEDGYEDELALMAEVRAYFDISSRVSRGTCNVASEYSTDGRSYRNQRFVDYVPQAIDEHLLYAFEATLLDTLVEGLGLTAEDAGARCARYLAEDADIAARREMLLAKKQRLDKVHKELYNFGL